MGLPGAAQSFGLYRGATAPPLDGMHEWPSTLFYLSWLLWGLVLAPATRLYQLRTRKRCAVCGRQPDPA
jgi:hypothetical protein